MPNVTNPMKADLDAATYAIANASAVDASTVTGTVALYSGTFAPGGNVGVIQLSDGTGSGPSVFADTRDPTAGAGIGVAVGSLLLRRVDAAHAECWFKVGPTPTDWTRVA